MKTCSIPINNDEIRFFSVMSDIELPDFSSAVTSPPNSTAVSDGSGGVGGGGHHLSIDLNGVPPGHLVNGRTKTKSGSTDNESNDSGNNSMNTNGSGEL